MPYYHATTVDRLPSILRHGLGGVDTGPRSVECDRGVYLATHPTPCILVVIEHYMARRGVDYPSPRDAIDAIRVLLIDDARIDPARLEPDPHTDGAAGTWIYRGVIDVTGMPVLTAAEAADAPVPAVQDLESAA